MQYGKDYKAPSATPAVDTATALKNLPDPGNIPSGTDPKVPVPYTTIQYGAVRVRVPLQGTVRVRFWFKHVGYSTYGTPVLC